MHLPRRAVFQLTHLFNHCFRLSYFPATWKEAKVVTLPKPAKDTRFLQNLRSISFLSTMGKLVEKVIRQIIQRHLDDTDLLNASQFGFRARHSTTFQCIRLTYHVTLNYNRNIFTAEVSLDIEKAFEPHGTLTCYKSYRYYNFRKI
jgi:hypothetical protein